MIRGLHDIERDLEVVEGVERWITEMLDRLPPWLAVWAKEESRPEGRLSI